MKKLLFFGLSAALFFIRQTIINKRLYFSIFSLKCDKRNLFKKFVSHTIFAFDFPLIFPLLSRKKRFRLLFCGFFFRYLQRTIEVFSSFFFLNLIFIKIYWKKFFFWMRKKVLQKLGLIKLKSNMWLREILTAFFPGVFMNIESKKNVFANMTSILCNI